MQSGIKLQAMRIIADKPLELLRALVNEHLARVIPLDGVQWLSDDSALPDPSRYVTLPSELCSMLNPASAAVVAAKEAARFTPVDLKALDTRIVLCGPAPAGSVEEVRFDVVAAIGPDFPTPILLLTSDGTVVHASHTNMAVDENGVIQIGGYESRISLMTTAEIRAERGKRVLLGGTCVTSFSVERRINGGPWSPVDIRFNPDVVELRELRAK